MMLKKTFLIVLLLISTKLFAQTPKRYKDAVFTDIKIDKDQSYGLGINDDSKKSHRFDLYQPYTDNVLKRPLIIWMHGGGFKFGSKDAKGIKLWSKSFAERGYVCAALNYTISKKDPLFNFKELETSTYNAVQDVKMAVAYFRQNAVKYHIDPDKIILAGNSAGGMIALQAAYSTNAELAKHIELRADEGDDTFSTDRLKVAAVINYWGGIFDINWLKNARVPIVGVYGTDDGIVKPDTNNGSLYGAAAIHKQADLLHIPNAVKAFQGYSHELHTHFNPFFPGGKDVEERWLQAGQFTADFLYDTVLDITKKADEKKK